jgi:hypothetical protein
LESTITRIVFTIFPIISAFSDTLRTVHTPHAVALTHTVAELLMLTMLMSIFQCGTVCGNLNQPAV